jgi:hypothetical protein
MDGLPCPQPLSTAIEGAMFGMEVGGPIVPDAEDVASITEEHAREMLVLLADITYLERCQAAGVLPESGRRPRTEEQRERFAARLTKELAYIRNKYEQCVDLYEQAFGADAARQLDHWVRASIQTAGATEIQKQQSRLFD